MVNLLPSFFILKIKTGGSRPARRHTFVRQQKYAKMPSPCGGHLLCEMSESSIDDTAQEAGPLQGPSLQCDLQVKSLYEPDMPSAAQALFCLFFWASKRVRRCRGAQPPGFALVFEFLKTIAKGNRLTIYCPKRHSNSTCQAEKTNPASVRGLSTIRWEDRNGTPIHTFGDRGLADHSS